ncbi:MAG: NCS2 family permease [Lentisphaerae bacterium]|nr:NCS2 family permease [Lentisphaerota bacterium]
MLNRVFRLAENNTTVRTELLAGLTTFLTMAYIIFVQPAVLSGALFGMDTGMDFGAVTTATCLAAALATAIMALWARYPIAQAPGMGENFFFVFSVLPAAAAAGYTNGWQVGLGVVFLSGVLFLALSLAGVREMIVNAVSPSLKNGIAVGIGLFIAFIGMQNAGLIVKDPGTAVKLNTAFASPDLIVFFFGLLLTASLHARRVRGSILWGILGATALTLILRFGLTRCPLCAGSDTVAQSALMTRFQPAGRLAALPPSLAPTAFKMDLRAALSLTMIPFIIIFLFMDIFDTIGTLIGVSEQAGFIKDNTLPRAGRAMVSDAIGTVAGACLGTSTVTSFIESAAGVEQGGRTGLTSLTTAALFLLALFFSPVIAMVGSYAPITAPALVIVGSMMIRNVRKVDWQDYSEAVPAFLAMVGIPLTYSIADGLALGFISYPLIKLGSGRGREVGGLMYTLGAVLLLYFLFLRA